MTITLFLLGCLGAAGNLRKLPKFGGENTPGLPISTPLMSAEETSKAKGRDRPNIPARKRQRPSLLTHQPAFQGCILCICQGWRWASPHQGAQA